jgi:hypothetical protein
VFKVASTPEGNWINNVILALDQRNCLKCARAFAAQQRELIAGLLFCQQGPGNPIIV